jgi:hypothetical protein
MRLPTTATDTVTPSTSQPPTASVAATDVTIGPQGAAPNPCTTLVNHPEILARAGSAVPGCRRGSAGQIGAIAWATKLPGEKPEDVCLHEVHRIEEGDASWVICATAGGVVPLELPTPVLSNVATRRADASASISAGSPVIRISAEILQQDQRNRTFTVSQYA